MKSVVCPACGQGNNPEFEACWKCSVHLISGQLVQPPPVKPGPPVVGFCMRFLADIMDIAILGITAMFLAMPLRHFLWPLGEDGAWAGFLITLFYTGLLQSSLGKGQSLAKKIFRIQVLRLDGSYMSLPQSFFRYSILGVIVYNSWIFQILNSRIPYFLGSYFEIALSAVILVLTTGCTILVAFHPLKRGFQDFAAGTLVVPFEEFNQEGIQALNDPAKTRRAYLIWIVVTAVLGAALFAFPKFSPREVIDLVPLQTAVRKETDFRNVSASLHITKPGNETTLTVYGFIPVKIFEQKEKRGKIQDAAAKVISRTYHGNKNPDKIYVAARSGFDMGMTSERIVDIVEYDSAGERVKKLP